MSNDSRKLTKQTKSTVPFENLRLRTHLTPFYGNCLFYSPVKTQAVMKVSICWRFVKN